MRRTVYNSPSDNQDSNQNDGTGGLPEGWQPRSPSPSENLPPELTREEMLEQRRIESQIRQMNRRGLREGPSNGQAGGTEQWEDFRNVKPRNVSNGVNGQGGNPDNIGFAGARGSQRIAEQIENGAPLDEIIPPQNNNPNAYDLPPQGVDRPHTLRVPEATIREQRVAAPANTEPFGINDRQGVGSFFQNRFLRTFTEQEQQNIFQAQQHQQTLQLTPEQQADQQRILETQQIVADSLRRAAEALERAREAQQRALDLQIELSLQRQAALSITPDLPRPAPQPTATQNQDGQNRESTPEPFPLRPPVDRSNFPGRKPGGGRE
jgi:hypothetical protein